MGVDGSYEMQLTLMYTDVPTKVLAMELMSSPDTPKSINLMNPCEFSKILEGLISLTRLSDLVPSQMNVTYLGE